MAFTTISSGVGGDPRGVEISNDTTPLPYFTQNSPFSMLVGADRQRGESALSVLLLEEEQQRSTSPALAVVAFDEKGEHHTTHMWFPSLLRERG